MGIEYAWKDWKFNRALWALLMERAIKVHDVDDLAEMLDVSTTSIVFWAQNRYTKPFAYPSMTNFLAVCNLLDIDPRKMFELEE